MKRDATITRTAASLWTSVRDPVLALAEELAQRRVATGRPPLTLRLRASGIEVWAVADPAKPLITATGRPADALRTVCASLSGRPGADMALELAADQAVTRLLTLPAQPPDVLRAIIRNKVEGLAPWPLAQCLWGMRVKPATGDARQVVVDVAVLSRALLVEFVNRLQAAGAAVRALSVRLPDGQEIAIDFGGEDVRRTARLRAGRLARIVAVVLVCAAVAGLAMIYRSSSALWRLEADTAAITASLRGEGGGQGETPLVASANTMLQARRARSPAVAVLNELSAVLPDTVYLDALVLSGDKLEMKGRGSDIPSLIAILEASPLFSEVNFASATERETDSQSNAFALTARLEPAAAGAAAP